jgi:imidazolonepropionase-like amidohydrolase
VIPGLRAAATIALLLSQPGILRSAVGQATPAPAKPILIDHVAVLDVVAGRLEQDRAVLVRGSRIAELSRGGSIRAPAGSTVIDGHGLVLMPGLWDSHVHQTIPLLKPGATGPDGYASNRRYFTDLFLANGVTGVRDMAGELDELVRWKRETAAGQWVGPRMLVTGQKLGGGFPVVPGGPWPTDNPEAIRQSVRLLKEHGADFVKLEVGITRDLYPVVAEASHEAGLPFVGHVSVRMNLGEASDFGQGTVEHLMGLALAVSNDEARLRTEMTLLNQPEKHTLWDRIRLWFRPISRSAVTTAIRESYDSTAAAALYARLNRNHTAQCPTLVAQRAIALRGRAPGPEDRAAAPGLSWHPPGNRPPTPIPAVDSLSYEYQLRLVKEMQRAGVVLLAGTDTPGLYGVPGFGLHNELDVLVQAGLTPIEAIRTATLNPARQFGLADSLGTVEQGKLADLVLLGADPIADIRNLRQIRAVMVNGVLLHRRALDSLSQDAESLATAWQSLSTAQ